MAIEHDIAKRSQELVNQINEAEKLNKPIDKLVKEHINLLEEFHDVFVKRADERNFSPIDKASGEIQIIGNIRSWAKKIGLPIDRYNKRIFDIRCSIFGEKITREKFGED